jgi:hypothetical protein
LVDEEVEGGVGEVVYDIFCHQSYFYHRLFFLVCLASYHIGVSEVIGQRKGLAPTHKVSAVEMFNKHRYLQLIQGAIEEGVVVLILERWKGEGCIEAILFYRFEVQKDGVGEVVVYLVKGIESVYFS